MAQPHYMLECPSCGAQLTPHAGHPDAAPWVCHNCHRGFWVAELTPAARALYRVHHHDWGHGDDALAVRQAVEAEHAAARDRGTSCLPEHLGLISHEHKEMLLRGRIHEDFVSVMRGSM